MNNKRTYDPFGFEFVPRLAAQGESLDYQMKDMEYNLSKIMDSDREMAALAVAAGFGTQVGSNASFVQNQNLFINNDNNNNNNSTQNRVLSPFTNQSSNVLRPITNNPALTANRRATNELKSPTFMQHLSTDTFTLNNQSMDVFSSPETDEMRILKLRNRTVLFQNTPSTSSNTHKSVFSPSKRPIEAPFSPPSKMKISETLINLNAFSPIAASNANESGNTCGTSLFINPHTPEMSSMSGKNFLSPSSSVASLSSSNSMNNLNMFLGIESNSSFGTVFGSGDYSSSSNQQQQQQQHLLPPSSLNTTSCSISSSPVVYGSSSGGGGGGGTHHILSGQHFRQMQTRSQTRAAQTNGTQQTSLGNNTYGNYVNNKKSVKMSVPSHKRQILEEEFRKEKYPSNEKLQKLSTKLSMRYDEVQNYFKKRRREEKETNHKFCNLVTMLNNYLEQED